MKYDGLKNFTKIFPHLGVTVCGRV